jgi:hypothetical protein
VFVLSLKAGGTGLNLTAANHAIHFDRWWNPAVEDQATDRAFRIGQHKNVQVRKLTCVGTLEERIAQPIAEKRELAERTVGSGEAWVTELDTAQLRELVALSGDAVAEAAVTTPSCHPCASGAARRLAVAGSGNPVPLPPADGELAAAAGAGGHCGARPRGGGR